MLFSTEWLAEYLDLSSVAIEELSRGLTAAGMAVEGCEATAVDTVLDVDVTTNRPDAMCHLGLAREAAVALGRDLRPPRIDAVAGAEGSSLVKIEEPELCRRYVGWVIRGVTVGPSPEWLARRLRAIGLRPINNVVDATNYVLWETGQPLHAFDLAVLAERRVIVRTAREGEALRTLDGENRTLDPSMLVIADADRPVALAGVMGGEESEVAAGTTEILVESAWFDPRAVRRTARGLGMHTDASHRFERGADPEGAAIAAARAVALIVELVGGEAEDRPTDARGRALPAPARIYLDPRRLDRFAGARIPLVETQRVLVGLGFELEPMEAEPGWAVGVPSWRRFDVLEEADVFEEVLRMVGFDRIPAALPAVAGPDAPELASHRLRRLVQDHLAACGFAESITYAFYGARDDASCRPWEHRGPAVHLENPLSELYDRMRRSLVPGIVSSGRFNRRRNLDAVRLFEIGNTFWRAADGAVHEAEHVALVAGGSLGNPWQGLRELGFFDLKGAVESLLDRLGVGGEVAPCEVPGLVREATAEWRDGGGRRLAILGRLADDDPGYSLFLAEIDLSWMPSVVSGRSVGVPSRYPGIRVDLTVTHDRSVPWRRIETAIREMSVPDLESFALENRYTGEGVPGGAVNTTIAFHYRAEDRSLTQDEVNERQAELAARLVERFGRKES
jgi:phenylalanyl-tRNA synthetase beta chain